MKLVLIVFCFSVFGVYGQSSYTWCFDKLDEFDDGYCYGYYNSVGADLIIGNNSSWHIGPPQKQTFNKAKSEPNVIVTDTINPYSAEDTSSFTLMMYLNKNDNYEDLNNPYIAYFSLGFNYSVDADSLSDYGMIELSPNSGKDWFDLINETSQYYSWSWPGKPTLTGKSNGFKNATVNMMGFVYEDYEFVKEDTLLIKFTFISDNIQNNRDGLMFDDIKLNLSFPINVQEQSVSSQEKEVVKVLDLLGRETQVEPNRVLIYVYSDGTREKKVVSDW